MEVFQLSKTEVKSYLGKYTYEFSNNAFSELSKELKDSDVILIDKKVASEFENHLNEFFPNNKKILIEPKESQKSYEGLQSVIEELIMSGFKRGNTLVAVGGGITQDSTAFIASILYRGVDWIFIPTTLLAQGDSCIGSKTSVNFGKYKNQLGGFFPPNRIIIDVNLLRTLPLSDLKSGIGEMCHYFLIDGYKSFIQLTDSYEKLLIHDEKATSDIIRTSLGIKKKMVEIDEFDKGPRQVFNYGHSFGHALETLSDYSIPHGIAVSIGMDMANYISFKLGYVNESFRSEIKCFLKKVWDGFTISDINIDSFVDALKKDKKNVGTQLGLILTDGFGKMSKKCTDPDDNFVSWLNEYFQDFIKGK